jgi:hypothetical protein
MTSSSTSLEGYSTVIKAGQANSMKDFSAHFRQLVEGVLSPIGIKEPGMIGVMEPVLGS